MRSLITNCCLLGAAVKYYLYVWSMTHTKGTHLHPKGVLCIWFSVYYQKSHLLIGLVIHSRETRSYIYNLRSLKGSSKVNNFIQYRKKIICVENTLMVIIFYFFFSYRCWQSRGRSTANKHTFRNFSTTVIGF